MLGGVPDRRGLVFCRYQSYYTLQLKQTPKSEDRFPACATPLARFVAWLHASAAAGRSEKVVLQHNLKRGNDSSKSHPAFEYGTTGLRGHQLRSVERRMDRLVSMQAFRSGGRQRQFCGRGQSGSRPRAATVTHHVQALEDHLGVTLLNRTTRRLNLTEVGAGLFPAEHPHLAQVE